MLCNKSLNHVGSFAMPCHEESWLITIAVVGREESKVTSIGVTPSRILDVVAITVVGSVFARLARKVHLERTLVGQHRIAHVHCGQGERNLFFGQFQTAHVTTHNTIKKRTNLELNKKLETAIDDDDEKC